MAEISQKLMKNECADTRSSSNLKKNNNKGNQSNCDLGMAQWVKGAGDGTPLQCSCLANPMDGGAWRAAVHGVARCQT